MSPSDLPPLALALGRIPTGLYIVASLQEGRPLGFVGSLLMQVGFEPPTVCLAIGHDRDHLAAIRSSERFAVSILDPASSALMGAFFKKYPAGESPFDGLQHTAAPSGCPILSESLAWLDCRVSGEHDVGDHVVVFGRITDGAQLREGDPAVHLRKNGLAY